MARLLAIITLFSGLYFTTGTSTAQAESYISDEIGVTMRSGPTNRYRVVGNLRAGTPITILQRDADNDSIQVSTLDGKRTGWVKSEYVSNKETVLAQYQKLQAETAKLQSQVSNLNQQLKNKNSIQSQNQDLQLQVSELENQVDQLSQQADLQSSRFFKEYFYAGALTLLFGMVIAWFITRSLYSRRQRSGWR